MPTVRPTALALVSDRRDALAVDNRSDLKDSAVHCEENDDSLPPVGTAYGEEMTTLETILDSLSAAALVGSTGNKLETFAKFLLANSKVEPVFLGYKPEGHADAYPNILCVSINNEVIHGIPDARPFEEGDVVSIDLGIKEDGLVYDGATTVLIGPRDAEGRVRGCSVAARQLVKATQEALEAGILAAKRTGNTNWSITEAVESVAKKYDLRVVEGYGGHGVGEKLHEEPFIANRAADNKGKAFELTSGLRCAIEPMLCTNSGATYVDKNGWTVKVRTGLAAHFEKTIIIP